MKYLKILMICVCLFLLTLPAIADQTADEATVRETVKKALDEFNKRDLNAHLSMLTEDYENWTGSMKGRKVREEHLIERWKLQKTAKYNVVEELGIHFVAPNVAIYKARCEAIGEVREDGTSIPSYKWFGAWVLVKKGEKWLIATLISRPLGE
ncbi:MAG: hypothetical protein WBE11_14310 [Candidatus Aminicenantaceae bacterium]